MWVRTEEGEKSKATSDRIEPDETVDRRDDVWVSGPGYFGDDTILLPAAACTLGFIRRYNTYNMRASPPIRDPRTLPSLGGL